MFIEKITLSGILNVEGVKEEKFTFHGDSSNSQNEFINTVNISFIKGFSFIFDAYFDENYDFRPLICNPREPFVEIKLWQRDTDSDSKYPWLLKNELTLKRNFRNPKELTINGKRTVISDFHEALSNLGYLSIESLQIHRLTELEVIKLGFLVGDDLWSMLMKIIACEELIEMTERKQGIVKRRAMKRTFDNYASKVERILPKKMKLHKDIHAQLTLKNNFFGVIEILQKRIEILAAYQETNLSEEIAPLKDEIAENYFSRFKKLKTFEIFYQQKMNIRVMREKAEQTQITMEGEIANVSQYSPPSPFVDDIVEIIQDSNEITKTLINNNEENVETTAWKILLKNSDGDENLLLDAIIEVASEIRSIKCDYRDAVEKDIEGIETEIQNSNKLSLDNLQNYFKVEKKFIEDYLKLEDEIIQDRSSVGETLEKLTEATFDAQIPMKYKFDLIIIDDLARLEESFQNDYIGPLFQFLDPKYTEINTQLWPQLMSTTNILLFRTFESAEKMAHIFIEAKTSPSYIAIGVDEYLKNLKESDEIEIGTDNFVSAKMLIKEDTPRALKRVLTHILRSFMLTKAEEWKYDTIDQLNITCYSEIISTIYHEGNTAVISQLSNSTWPKIASNPIQALHIFYDKMEERRKLCQKIMELENVRESAQKATRKELMSIDNKLVKEKSKKVSASIVHSILTAGKNYLSDTKKKIEALQALEQINESIDELQDELENLSFIAPHLDQKENPLALTIFKEFLEASFNETPQLLAHVNGEQLTIKQKAERSFSKHFQKFNANLGQNINKMTEWQILMCESKNLVLPNANDLTRNNDSMSKFAFLYAKKTLLDSVTESMKISTKTSKGIIRYDKSLTAEYQNRANDEVVARIGELYEALLKEKRENNLRLNNLTAESYLKLVESIKKVPKYGHQEVYTPLDIKKRAYPLMNFLAVKMLRDTVHHFKISYNVIFSEYLNESSLFFYTHGEINQEVEEDKFSWNCFDMTRLKSIDFVDKWERGEKPKVGLEKIKQIKAFLLILHIINYISIFKFIIISAQIFKDLNPALESKLRAFLKTISTFVQVLIIDEDGNQEQTEVEGMDISG